MALFLFGLPDPTIYSFPVYNLIPPAGVPAAFGFNPVGLEVTLLPNVQPHANRGDGAYSLVAHTGNISQSRAIPFSSVTLWGVPAEASHDKYRGQCINEFGESVCTEASNANLKPFLRMPTSCSGIPLTEAISADSWPAPGTFVTADPLDPGMGGQPVVLNGCGRLDFSPSLAVKPYSEATSAPTALSVDLQVPQNDDPTGLGESDLRGATVSLPTGIVINPAAADGLEACTPAEIELEGGEEPTCPDASKLGTVEVLSPLLETPLEGAVYQAPQNDNPFHSLLAFYIVAHGQGVTIKMPGKVSVDPVTGQITTSVEDAPQLPFSDFKLNFFGGSRAPLSTPATCGEYAASASLTPWSGTPPISPLVQPFKIADSCGGGFAPSFTAETIDNQAGGFSPLSVTLSRTDRDQNLGQISVHTPPGLLGMLSNVLLCDEPQAALGECSAASQIGHATVGVGAGPHPLFVPQAGNPQAPVFLTGPYKGAPFGLSIKVPAHAGPFDLGTVVVRAAIYIDPHTATLTIVSDQLPRILQGIPLDVRTVNVMVDREHFIFNPTNCSPLAITGTAASTLGAAASISTPFQAANCAALPFHPKFTASTEGQSSKKGGASLDVKVTSSDGQANIGKVVVTLPKQLPARLTTLQQACPEATFAADPATCPAGSNVGTAKADTPVLNEALIGPAYLVSHGGAAFPDLVVILQGQGVRLDLVGGTNIKKSITTSTFASVPDAPLSSFELKLPQGSHSALASNLPAKARGDLCSTKLVMPISIGGQNGAQIKQNTKITAEGCPKARAGKASGRRTLHASA